MSRNPMVAVLGAGLFALLAGQAAGGTEYRDEKNHFSFQLADGWVALPPRMVDAKNQFLARIGSPVRFSAGFQLAREAPGSMPYIWLQIEEKKFVGMSYAEIDRELAAMQNAKVEEKRLGAQNTSIDKPTLDRVKNQYKLRIESELAGLGKIDEVTIATIGGDATVLLHCCCKAVDFGPYLTVFQAMADSLQFDPGHHFVARSVLPAWLRSYGIPLVLIVAAAGAFYWVSKLRSRKAAATSSAQDSPATLESPP